MKTLIQSEKFVQLKKFLELHDYYSTIQVQLLELYAHHVSIKFNFQKLPMPVLPGQICLKDLHLEHVQHLRLAFEAINCDKYDYSDFRQ